MEGGKNALRSLKIIRVLRLIRLLKLVRLLKLGKLMKPVYQDSAELTPALCCSN